MIGAVEVEIGSVKRNPGALLLNLGRGKANLLYEGLIVDLPHECLPSVPFNEQVVRKHCLQFSLLRHDHQCNRVPCPMQFRDLDNHEREYSLPTSYGVDGPHMLVDPSVHHNLHALHEVTIELRRVVHGPNVNTSKVKGMQLVFELHV
jgi:hypothetical protein